ncbi:MAG: PQ-loop domain-containing transporter [Gammaproteobacteria bacterium]
MWLQSFIETFFSLGLFVNAALFVPQAIRLYKTKDAVGFSLITFFGFNLIQLFTILHGYLHHDLTLAIGYLLSLITCGIVTFLICLYRIKK